MSNDFWFGWLLGAGVTMAWLIPLNAWHVRAMDKINQDYVDAREKSHADYVKAIKRIYNIPE